MEMVRQILYLLDKIGTERVLTSELNFQTEMVHGRTNIKYLEMVLECMCIQLISEMLMVMVKQTWFL